MALKKFIIIGGRNIAAELKKSGCNAQYLAASDFLFEYDQKSYCNTTIILAHSSVLSRNKYGTQASIPMNKVIDKFIKIRALHKIVLSSAAVYGLRASCAPLDESSRILGSSEYALEKKNLERRIRKSHILNSNITILRLSSVLYSDLTKSGNLFTKLAELQTGYRDQLIVENQGMQLRDFCTIDALITVLNNCSIRNGLSIYNLADIEVTDIKSVINLFLNKQSQKNVTYLTNGNHRIHCHLDTHLAMNSFGIQKIPISKLIEI